MSPTNKIVFPLFAWSLLLLCINTSSFAQRQFGEGGHQQTHHGQGDSKGMDDMPSVCQHLQALVHNHEHADAVHLIYETLKENKHQPDCFFYNARLYFAHRLSGSHVKGSKPLFDSLMTLYDDWFAASRAPTMVLNWKGRDLRDYYIKQPDSLRKYCAMYKRIYDADKESMHPYNLKVLAFCACDLHGKIDVDTLWHFTRNKALTNQEAAWKASYKSLKRELIACPRMSCVHLHSLLHPVMSSGKEGSEETGKIAALMSQRGCRPDGTQDPNVKPPAPVAASYTTASEAPVKKETTAKAPKEEKKKSEADAPQPETLEEPELVTAYDALFKIAQKHMMEKKFKEALYGYGAALKSATNPIEKADSYMGMALASDSAKDYASAKKYAMLVHETLPDEVEGMKYLSKLYQKGEDYCGFHTPKEHAAFYVLLSNVAWSLGNSEEADGWRENANLNELYRTGNAQKGEKVMVGCFINEEVTLP